jgi:hypothetical protein
MIDNRQYTRDSVTLQVCAVCYNLEVVGLTELRCGEASSIGYML